MIEDLEDSAKEELKRADHLVYITLKYTRTVDVIKNTIKRLISAFDFAILELLEFAKKRRKIKEISRMEKLRAEMVREVFPEIKDYIDFYFSLKSIDRAEFTKKGEYRKNVTLIVMKTPENFVEVTMDVLKEYFYKTKEFIDFVGEFVKGKKK